MKTGSDETRRSGCPISLTLEVLGDAWSLLIVRDLMLNGRKTFNEFLAADEGIATNILSERLQRLERHGIVLRRRDPADGRRMIYRLTEKGIDLAPVLAELIVWGSVHTAADTPPALRASLRRDKQGFLRSVRARWRRSQEAEGGKDDASAGD